MSMSKKTVDSQNETEIPDTQKYKNTQNHGGSAGNSKPGSVSDAQQQFDISHH